MSPNANDPTVAMLPPSFAVYVNRAVVVPILIKSKGGDEPPEVFVAPVLLAGNIQRIYWSLVLSGSTGERVGFVPGRGIEFTSTTTVKAPVVGPVQDLSATQVARDFDMNGVSAGIAAYTINFSLGSERSPSLRSFQITISADPSVSVMPEPVDIPTWP